jgi:hypothetical protein
MLTARSFPRWLEVAGQLLAVTTILLPLLGSVVRLVSFAVTPGVSMPLELAPATALPDLVGAALTGLAPSVAATTWYLLVFGLGVALWRAGRMAWGTPAPTEATDEPPAADDPLSTYRAQLGVPPDIPDRPMPPPRPVWRHPRLWAGEVQKARRGWDEGSAADKKRAESAPKGGAPLTRDTIVSVIFLVFGFVSIGYVVLQFATQPADQGPASALWFLAFAVMTALTLTLGWPTRVLVLFAIAWLVVISALAGLIYRGEVASYYDMDSQLTAISDGWYARVGERDGFLYLMPCPRATSPVVAVRADAIRGIRTRMSAPARSPAPSLWALAVQRGVERLGLDPACP